MAARKPRFLETVGMQVRLAPEVAVCLQQRLPAEVVVRQKRVSRKTVEEEQETDEVEVDLKVACALKPARRLAWLQSACRMVRDGRTASNELFNIITTRRFIFGISRRLGQEMAKTVDEIMDTFSDKQHRHLRSDEWVLDSFKGTNSLYDDPDAEAAEEEDDEGEKDEATDSKGDVEAEKPAQNKPSKPPQPVPKPGGWVSVSFPNDEKTKREERQREAREARAREREEQGGPKQEEQQKAKTKKIEEEVDSSIQMLELMTQQRGPSPHQTGSVRDPYRRSRSRRGRDGRGRRGLSRSRSVSVQMPSPSPPRRSRKSSSKDSGPSFEELLRQRMSQRDKNDTTRGNIVQENYQGKTPKRLKFDAF